MRKELFLLVIHAFITIVFSIVVKIIPGNSDYDLFHLQILSWMLVISFGWILSSWYFIRKTWFDPYTVFIISAMVFNGGFALLEVFPIHDQVPYLNFFNLSNEFTYEEIYYALSLVLRGFMAFHFGALLSSQSKRRIPENLHDKSQECLDIRIRQVGWGLIIISIIPIVISSSTAIRLVSMLGYKGGWIQLYSARSIIRITADFFVPGCIFLIAGSKNKIFTQIIAVLGVFSYSAIYLLIGVRRYAIAAIIASVWVWDYCIKKLPRRLLAVMGFLLIFVISPIISATRKVTGIERFSTEFLIYAFSNINEPLQNALVEFGRSVQIIAYTVGLVPNTTPFINGRSYILSLTSIIPNLFWKIHPAAKNNLADWFVRTQFPEIVSSGTGFGFSFIAEAYMNFSWVGSLFILALIGYIYAKFILWGTQTINRAKTAAVASFLSFFLLYARGESYLQPRYLVWYSLLPYLFVQIIPVVRFKKTAE